MPYKKITFFIIILILLITINNLAHSIYITWQKQDLVKKTQQELAQTEKDNQKLKQEVARVQQPQFIENEARNKLLLTKPGEDIIVIPTGTIVQEPSTTSPPQQTQPYWQQWWKTFF